MVFQAEFSLRLFSFDRLVGQLHRRLKLCRETSEFIDGCRLHTPCLARRLDLATPKADIDISLVGFVELENMNERLLNGKRVTYVDVWVDRATASVPFAL